MSHRVTSALREELSKATESAFIVAAARSAIAALLSPDIIHFRLCADTHSDTAGNGNHDATIPLSCSSEGFSFAGMLEHQERIVSDVDRVLLPAEVRKFLARMYIRSFALLPLRSGGSVLGCLFCAYTKRFHRFTSEEINHLRYTCDVAALHIERLADSARHMPPPEHPPEQDSALPLPTKSAEDIEATAPLESVHERAARFGNLVMVRTDAELAIVDIVGDSDSLLGISRKELLHDPRVWNRLVAREDLKRLSSALFANPRLPFSEEIRITNVRSGEERWLSLRAVPIAESNGAASGWEGIAVDVTARFRAEEDVRRQKQRLEALYELSRAIQASPEPNAVILRGLRALVSATHSDCGFGCLRDPNTGTLEISASEGLSAEYVDELGKIISARSLAREAAESQKGIVLEDIRQDPRAAVELAAHEGLRATIIVPLVFEGSTLGVIALFRRTARTYGAQDFDLVSAASSQLALSARQAELLMAERRQSASLSALYRLSHELSKQMTIKEVAEHAFPAIQEELACKRIWLGIMNERGTHIAGQAGFGPGIRKNLIDLQIELNLRHDFLDEALQRKTAVIVEGNRPMECSGLNRVLRRLRCELLVIIPLVSLGQVVGVLVVEPAVPSAVFIRRRLPLLSTMAGEIATVLVARRFEARMADADKMRMAGLLASGVAHNFNNLLQAVMGQASLIELQAKGDDKLVSAARMISDAAGRGASLVKQLFHFSMQGGSAPQAFSVGSMLNDSYELYRSVLGSKITLDYEIADDSPDVTADFAQIQQVITNLLMNAKEAISQKEGGRVRIATRRVRLRSGEVDPELAPGVYLQVEVQDNGQGMTPEACLRCFEPFFTTKNADARTGIGFGGSGLGLSSAYSILKAHDGIITVHSQPSQGATFTLYLPAVVERRSSDEIEAAPEIPEQAAAWVVFHAVEAALAYSSRSSIEALGIPVALEDEPERLHRLVAAAVKTPPLLVIDIDRAAPGFCLQVERWLRDNAHLRAIFLSSSPLKWQDELVASRQAVVLNKPVGIWSLNSLVRRILAQDVRTRPVIEVEHSPGSTAKANRLAHGQLLTGPAESRLGGVAMKEK